MKAAGAITKANMQRVRILAQKPLRETWLVTDSHGKRFILKRLLQTTTPPAWVNFLKTTDNPLFPTLHRVAPQTDALDVYLEYIPGQPLSQSYASLQDPLESMQGLLLAVADLHAHGLVHGDLKPEHIIVTPQGRLYLIDFDLCRPIQHISYEGTPEYMAPERLKTGVALPQGDVYALAVLLTQWLNGFPPLVSPALNETSQINLAHKKIQKLRPHLSDILAKAKAPQPNQRYINAAAFLQAMYQSHTLIRTSHKTWRLISLLAVISAGFAAYH